jgi:hypothetical protein
MTRPDDTRPDCRQATMRKCAVILLASSLLGGSCHHTVAGTSSFAFVGETGNREPAPKDAANLRIAEPISILIPPKPLLPLKVPVYPESIFREHLQDIQMAVTITIDKAGRVSDVSPSLARFPYTNRFQAEFQLAIERAVASWHFEPGQLAHLDPQSQSAPVVVGIESVESQLTVAFTFRQSGLIDAPIFKK